MLDVNLQPELGPPLPKKDRNISTLEKIKLLKAGVIPFLIFFLMTGLFLMGIASLVECSAVGALLATLASIYKKRFNRKILDTTLKKTLRCFLHVYVDYISSINFWSCV